MTKEELQEKLDRILDIGVYPKKIIGGPTAYEERTPWMEGWNAATQRMCDIYDEKPYECPIHETKP